MFKNDAYRPDIDTILDIARLPFLYQPQEGGAPSSSKHSDPIYDGGKYFQNKTFTKAFDKFKISSIVVFGFRGRYTVFIYDKDYFEKAKTNTKAFSFELNADQSKPDFENQIRTKIVEVLDRLVNTKSK